MSAHPLIPLRPVPLDGARVHLRPAGPSDAAAFAIVLADPAVAPWWLAPDPDAEGTRLAMREDVAVWAIELDSAVIGVIQAWEEPDPEYRHAGIDLSLRGAVHGRGLGPDAIRAVARWLFDSRGHHRITIDPRADNVRAIRAYEKVGFQRVGILREVELGADGGWHDGLLMDMLRRELVPDA